MHLLTPLPSEGTASDSSEKTVTVLVHRTIAKAQAEEFMTELRTLLTAFDAAPGSLGSKVFQEETGDELYIGVVQRFASSADHQAWVASDTFRCWKEKMAPPRFGADHVRRYYGMEALFDTSPSAPPRWKMAVVLGFAAFPISFTLSKWFGPFLGSIDPIYGALLTTPIMSVLMTYLLVPLATRIFQKWLNA